MNAANVFRILWNALPPSEERETQDVMRNLLEKNGWWVINTYEELETLARSELNMVNRDDVRQIAADEYGMIDGPES